MFESVRASITRKFMLMQMVTAAGVLTLAGLVFLGLEVAAFKRTESRELRTLGQLIANNAAPTVAFEDPEAAGRILDGLRVRPSITLARIYRADGDLMAGFPAYDPVTVLHARQRVAGAAHEGITTGNNRLRLTQLIRDREGAPIGLLLLEEDLRELNQRILSSSLVLLAVLLVLGGASFLVSLRMQGMLIRPILDLSGVADAVSRTQDYGLRARKWAGDELGQLADTFNTMLAKIQGQDHQLAEHREHLERLVDHRTLQLTQANEELLVAKSRAEEFSRAKSAFLSNMSHELRTPLNAILGYTQLMAFDPARDPQDRRQLEMILRAGEHLLGLINDVLSVARIEAQQQVLVPAPFELRQFLLGIEEMIRIRAKSKGIALHVELDPGLAPVLVGDAGKLRQVLVNLLGNAVKFTQDGGVALAVRLREPGRVLFEIRDTGPGIAPEEASGLFNAFFQTGSGRSAKEGTGLGLYLSQSLVRLMGGEIQVASQVDQGSRFFFEVPLPAGDEVPLEARALPGLPRLCPDQGLPRQLVVDDNEDNRNLLASLFATLGLPCRTANDGRAGLDLWREWQPEVVWMDMRMPGMDGFEATRRLRAEEAGSHRTTVLAVTASVFEHDREGIYQAGCDDVLIKPYRIRDLLGMLARHTGLRFEEAGAPAPSLEVPPEALRAVLAAMAPEWRHALRSQLALGDTDQALSLLARIPPGHADAVQGLKACLDEFRLDELERLLQQAGEAP